LSLLLVLFTAVNRHEIWRFDPLSQHVSPAKDALIGIYKLVRDLNPHVRIDNTYYLSGIGFSVFRKRKRVHILITEKLISKQVVKPI
jgi:hypothetical protein